jgi:hypothetical protein
MENEARHSSILPLSVLILAFGLGGMGVLHVVAVASFVEIEPLFHIVMI